MPWLLFNIIVSSEFVTPKYPEIKVLLYIRLYICMFFKIYNSTISPHCHIICKVGANVLNLTLPSCLFYLELEALRERRPPWPRQIITPTLPTVKMLSLGSERLAPSLPPPKKKKKKKKKVLDHYLHHDLGMLPLLWYFFLLIYSS